MSRRLLLSLLVLLAGVALFLGLGSHVGTTGRCLIVPTGPPPVDPPPPGHAYLYVDGLYALHVVDEHGVGHAVCMDRCLPQTPGDGP